MAMSKGTTREEVREQSAASLQRMRESGIQFVELLGPGAGSRSCRASSSLRRQKIEIALAAPLPLADCDKEFCKCLYIARQ